MKTAFLCLSLSLACLQAMAQHCAYTVVARSGLNIRDKAALDGKKLATVPYLECVEMLQKPSEDDMNELRASAIKVAGMEGHWVKVEYKGTVGWAFSAFIGMPQIVDKPDTPYGLIDDDAFCNTEMFPKGSYKLHYAMVSDQQDNWSLVAVELDYHFLLPDECTSSYQFNMKTTHSQMAEAVLCSNTPFTTGALTTFRSVDKGQTTFEATESGVDIIDLGDAGQFKARFQGKHLQFLDFMHGGQQQEIDMCVDDVSNCHTDAREGTDLTDPYADAAYIQLRWAGDLDGDGKTDFLLDGTFDEYMVKDLWLSSLAKPGQLVGRAGRFRYWYCC